MPVDLTFREIVLRVERFVQDTSSGRETRIKDVINNEYDDVATRYDWPQLWRLQESGITTVASQKYLFLPKDVSRLIAVAQLTDPAVLNQVDREGFLRRTIDSINSTGNSIHFTEAGVFAQKANIATAEAMKVVSSSASDTTQQVLVRGLVSGEEVFELLTLNGTTEVTGTKTYDAGLSILAFGSNDTVSGTSTSRQGTITLKGASSATVYATLGTSDFSAKYRVIRLFYVPGSAMTILLAYSKRVSTLISNHDIPEIPVSRYLVERSIGKIYQQMRKNELAIPQLQEAERILDDVISQYAIAEGRMYQAVPEGGSFSNSLGWGYRIQKATD